MTNWTHVPSWFTTPKNIKRHLQVIKSHSPQCLSHYLEVIYQMSVWATLILENGFAHQWISSAFCATWSPYTAKSRTRFCQYGSCHYELSQTCFPLRCALGLSHNFTTVFHDLSKLPKTPKKITSQKAIRQSHWIHGTNSIFTCIETI